MAKYSGLLFGTLVGDKRTGNISNFPTKNRLSTRSTTFASSVVQIDAKPITPHAKPQKKQCNRTEHSQNGPRKTGPEGQLICVDLPKKHGSQANTKIVDKANSFAACREIS